MSASRYVRAIPGAETGALIAALEHSLTGAGNTIVPWAEGTAAIAEGAPEEVDVIVATSGSSGIPKRVAHSGSALLAGAQATAAALGGHGQWLLALPAHNIAGLQVLVRSIAAGTTPVVLPPGHFDPEQLRLAAGRMGGRRRFISLVPAQLLRVLEDRGATTALAGFDAVLIGGQATPVALRERAEAAGIRIVRTYGSSETGGGAVYDGLALPGVRLRLGENSELECAAPQLALGYVGEDGAWDRTLMSAAFRHDDEGRWYRTGDRGSLEGERVSVLGRLDNVLISGGTNVSLDRVEALVRELPGLAEAVVVAAPSERWGEVPVVVVASGSSAISLSELRARCREALGPAAAPERILEVSAIPLLPSGKPDRRGLAAAAAR